MKSNLSRSSDFIPFFFVLNKTNYARYGSYYVEILDDLEILYPGLKSLLAAKSRSVQAQDRQCIRTAIDQRGEQTTNKDAKTSGGMSIQAQDRHCIRTAIDQRGEQTTNKDAKISVGIKSFAANSASVLKWCLNRSEQAENTRALKELCGISTNPELYKPCRPSQITSQKSNELVNNVVQVLTNHFINPLGQDLDKDQLVNVSSDVFTKEEVANYILTIPEEGTASSETFRTDRLSSNKCCFSYPNPEKKDFVVW